MTTFGRSLILSETVERLTTCQISQRLLMPAVILLPCLHRISSIAAETFAGAQKLCHICDKPVKHLRVDSKLQSIVHALWEPHNEKEWMEIALANWTQRSVTCTYPGKKGTFRQDPQEPITFINSRLNAFLSKFKIESRDQAVNLKIFFKPSYEAMEFWRSWGEKTSFRATELSVFEPSRVKALFAMIHENNPLDRKALLHGYRAIIAQIACPSDHLTERVVEAIRCPSTGLTLTKPSTCVSCGTIQTDSRLDEKPLKCWKCRKNCIPDLTIQNLVKEILHSNVPAMAFGKAEWRKYFGDIGDEPPLPAEITTILRSPCPFWPEESVEENHILVLVPKTVNGKPWTLRSLFELMPKPVRQSFFGLVLEPKHDFENEILQSYQDKPADESHWVFLTKDVLPGTLGQSYAKQKQILSKIPLYEVPRLLEAATAILMQYVQSRDMLFEDGFSSNMFIWSYRGNRTRCYESTSEGRQYTVGNFDSYGSWVQTSLSDHSWHGLAGLRKF